MTHAFDRLSPGELRAGPSKKWRHFDPDVLPLWVADMDLPVAEAIRAALHEHARAGAFGYPPDEGLPGLRETVTERLAVRFGWQLEPDSVVPLAGVIPALAASVRAFAARGDGVLTLTPVYPPFLEAIRGQGRLLQNVDLRQRGDRFCFEPGDLDEAVTTSSRLLMLCHPHNPTGRVFDARTLREIAERARRHDLIVVSDELHADLNYGVPHRPFATVEPDLAERTVTLYGPTKAFNIAGLSIGFAIVEDAALRERLRRALRLATPKPGVLAQAAARAAFREGDGWLEDAVAYLRGNRDALADAVEELPGVRLHPPEATYLAWLDFRDTPFAGAPAEALLEHARVALNEGADFGEAGRGFARLNFATARPLLHEALERISRSLDEA